MNFQVKLTKVLSVVLFVVISLGLNVSGVCKDKSKVWFGLKTFEGKKIRTCVDAVNSYPEMCESIGLEGGECCMSCKAAGEPTCLDKVTRERPTSVTRFQGKTVLETVHITNCTTIVNDHPAFCSRSLWGGPRQKCCRSCSARCEDTLSEENALTIYMFGVAEIVSSCRRLIEAYPTHCDKYGLPGGKCCRTCKEVGNPGCLDKITPISYSFFQKTFENGTTGRVYITSCSQIMEEYITKCHPERWGGPNGVCCHSCQQGAKFCTTYLDWRLDSDYCPNCSCLDIAVQKGVKTFNYLCEKNKNGFIIGKTNPIGIQQACCLYCKDAANGKFILTRK